MPNPLIESLLRAIDASPEDLPLRLHVAELLLAQGHSGEAIAQIAAVLQRDPGAEDALAAMARALGATTAVAPSASVAQGDPLEPANTVEPTHPVGPTETIIPAGSVDPAEPAQSQAPVPSSTADDDEWDRAAHQLSDAVASGDEVGGVAEPLPHGGDEPADQDVWNVEDPDVTLADVGGLQEVKDRLEVSFLAPMRNPELRAMYGKSLRGGLLLYGPPGCGKTF
ncbi:MAG: tetratricopeptide repeat protein, partial [Propioniciclava sp.]